MGCGGLGGREVSETEKWSLIILSWGRLMQFWKVLNYFPIFMIAYTYKTWTSLLEETGLRTNSSGRQYRWESEKHSGLRRTAQAAEQAQPCQPCLSLLHEHLWELAHSPRELWAREHAPKGSAVTDDETPLQHGCTSPDRWKPKL